jgi:hypothetical protein
MYWCRVDHHSNAESKLPIGTGNASGNLRP